MELLGNNICIRYIPLPFHCGGFTIMDDECFYNMYINSLSSLDRQRKTIEHELKHIKKDHFFLDIPTALKEKQANENN